MSPNSVFHIAEEDMGRWYEFWRLWEQGYILKRMASFVRPLSSCTTLQRTSPVPSPVHNPLSLCHQVIMTPYNALPLYPPLYTTHCHCVIKSLWHPITHFPCTLPCTQPTVIVSSSHYDTLQRTSPVPSPVQKWDTDIKGAQRNVSCFTVSNK